MTAHFNPHMLPKVRSEALTQAVRGMPCSLRVASFLGERCAHEDTVVGCHIGGIGKGTGTKVSDLHIAAGCRLCHDLVDGRDPRGQWIADRYPAAFVERLMLGVFETQSRFVQLGLIEVKGMEII